MRCDFWGLGLGLIRVEFVEGCEGRVGDFLFLGAQCGDLRGRVVALLDGFFDPWGEFCGGHALLLLLVDACCGALAWLMAAVGARFDSGFVDVAHAWVRC